MLGPARAAFEAGLAVAPEDAAPVYLRSNVCAGRAQASCLMPLRMVSTDRSTSTP